MSMYQIKQVLRTERLPNTKDGNPRYRVFFADGDQRLTKPDASVAYRIGNSELSGFVQVKLEKGMIVDMQPAIE